MERSIKNLEIIAYDLRPILKRHPKHAAAIESLVEGANPRYCAGVLSTACCLRRFGRDMSDSSGFWKFEGETAEQRDARIIADMKDDLLQWMNYDLDVLSDDLTRIIFALKPAYYYEYPRQGKATKKILKPGKKVFQKDAPALDVDELLAARTAITSFLSDAYGAQALFTPLKGRPAQPRFLVFVSESGLSVKVTLTDGESRTEGQLINGTPFDEFIQMVPTTFASFNVKTTYWSLDQSLCDDE